MSAKFGRKSPGEMWEAPALRMILRSSCLGYYYSAVAATVLSLPKEGVIQYSNGVVAALERVIQCHSSAITIFTFGEISQLLWDPAILPDMLRIDRLIALS